MRDVPASEPAVLAARLAHRLGCETIALVGCVRPELVAGLPQVDLVGFDAPEHLGSAAALLPAGRWEPLERVLDTVQDVPNPFVVLSSSAFDTLDDETLRSLLSSAPAALVHDVDRSSGTGPAALRQRIEGVHSRGFKAVRSELIAPLGSTTHRRSSPALLISDGHDGRLDYLVSTGLHGLRLDPAVEPSSKTSRSSRVCIVSYEVVGPCRNGGIGTANTSLALALARAGHDVTLIYTGDPSDESERDDWVRHFSERGVTYEQIESAEVAAVASAFVNVRRAWAVYERVRELNEQCRFDVIHGPDCQGHLAFVVLAKRHGIAFEDAELVTGVHSPTRWCFEANRFPLETLTGLADEYLEQTSVANADAVVSPSGYLLGYLRARGWRLPERSFVQQYTTSEAIRDLQTIVGQPEGEPPQGPPSELVFFGRLEKRKGLEAFCNALDQLAEEPQLRGLRVTFMGSAVTIDAIPSVEYVNRRIRNWPWPVTIETNKSQPEAVRHLRDGHCLAVMPSLVDNSPNTVYEVLALGIPLIVSRSGGTAELISIDDLERCSFSGWPEDDVLDPVPADIAPRKFDDGALAELLRSALREKAAPVRPAVDPSVNEACHVEWHAALAARGPLSREPRAVPTLSTILVTNEPTTVRSIAAHLHDEANEVVIAFGDKGLLPADLPTEWMVLDTGRATAGQAHNIGAHAASGQLLLFLSDEVIPDARLAERMRAAAAGTCADVLLFPVHDAPDSEDEHGRVVVPTGGPAVLALSHPFFGTSGFAIRAEALRALGGFSDTGGGGSPPVELLTRAVAAGLTIEVVPEVLGRRVTPDPLRALTRRDVWPEAVPWALDGEQLLGLLRIFLHSPPTADLPALYRSSQELLARVLAETRDGYARWDDAYKELQAHTDRVQKAYEQALLEGEAQQSRANRYERRILDGEQHRALAHAETQLNAIYSSRSWKVTAPLRLLGRLLPRARK